MSSSQPQKRSRSVSSVSSDDVNANEVPIHDDDMSTTISFSGNSNFSEYDVRSSSSASHYMDSNLSEYDVRSPSSTSFYMDSMYTDSLKVIFHKVREIIGIPDEIVSSDSGYLPDDSDVQITKANIYKTNLNLPARFKTCVQCRKENDNPYFQYCSTCFKFRMEYFENKPTLKQKRIRLSRKENVLKDSQESSFGSPCEFLSQTENVNSKDIEANKAKIEDDSNNLCNICLTKPKNGVINHGKIGHVYSCYPCAKILCKKSNKCPLCNVKIKCVTKLIIE